MITERERLLQQPTIAIHGWTHSPYNVQGALRAGAAFGDFVASLPKGSSVVFFDEAGDVSNSRQEQDDIHSLVSNYGLTGFEIAMAYSRRNGVPLTHGQLAGFCGEMAEIDIDSLISRYLSGDYPLSLRLSTFALYHHLDRFDPEGRTLLFELEKHDPATLRHFGRKNADFVRRCEKVDDLFEKRGGAKEISHHERMNTYGLTQVQIRYRERRIARQVMSLRRADPTISGIFMLYGSSHMGIQDRLRRWPHNGTYQTNQDLMCYPRNHEVELMRSPETRPDFDFKCEFLCSHLMDRVCWQCQEEGLLREYLFRYEDIEHELWNQLFSLPEDVLDGIFNGGIHSFFSGFYNWVRSRLYEGFA